MVERKVRREFQRRGGQPSWVWLLVALMLPTLASGCMSMGGMIAVAPNYRKARVQGENLIIPPVESWQPSDGYLRVKVGPPEAHLSVWVVDPPQASSPPKNTVLVLHGMGARSFWMHGTAESLAASGSRAVLVDLRGHGSSSGSRLSYGLREARDLSQVIDALADRDLLVGEVGVFGISYGASTAIHLAAIDDRVQAVVAVAPFSDMRSEVSHYLRTVALPGVGRMLSEESIQEAIDEAGRIGGYEPDMADAAVAVQQTTAPVLLVHGKNDQFVPASHSQRIHDAARNHSELMLLDGHGHLSIWRDRGGEVDKAAKRWFASHLQ